MNCMTGHPRWIEQVASAARFLCAFWLGAALLFVIAGVREVTSDQLDQRVRDILVARRFPAYYAVAAGTLGACVPLTGLLATRRRWARDKWIFATFLFAAVIQLADYLWIYQPLLAMATPPGQIRPPGFQPLHQISATVNALNWLLILTAACGLYACPPMFWKTQRSGA